MRFPRITGRCADVEFTEIATENREDIDEWPRMWDLKGANGEQGHIVNACTSCALQGYCHVDHGYQLCDGGRDRTCECGKIDLGDHHTVRLR